MNPTIKKCRRGKGIRLTASLRRSAFSWPVGHVHTRTISSCRACKVRQATGESWIDHLSAQPKRHMGIRCEQQGFAAISTEEAASKKLSQAFKVVSAY